VEPFFRNLHDDPRWQLTLARIGFADSQVDKIDFDVTLPE